MPQKINLYIQLVRLHKPIGIFLLLWPALWAIWIAGNGAVSIKVVVIFVLGVVLMRSAGCAINDYADREFDKKVRRTVDRPLARGELSPNEALIIFAVLCVVAFLMVLLLNKLTIYLSLGAVVLAAAYPFMKRLTFFPQVFLGIAFAWSVPMAFAAQAGAVNDFTWYLFLATVVWTIAYDTMYAMVDREDDIRIGVKSTAILFGDADKLIIGMLQFTFLMVLFTLGIKASLSLYYYYGLVVAAALCIYQQHLIRDREPAQCFKAFLNNNYVGMAVFAGILANYLFE